MKQIIVRESYDKICFSPSKENEHNFLNSLELSELRSYFSKNKLKNNIQWGSGELKFVNCAGFVQLSNVSIEIVPKLYMESIESNRKVIVNMLKKTGYLDISHSDIVNLKLENDNLIEIYAYIFSKTLKDELQKGIYSNYIHREENLNILKGKLDVKNQIQNIIKKKPHAYCKYDDFIPDNFLNQILKAITKLLLFKVKKIKTLDNLRFCLINFCDVSDIQLTKFMLNHVKFDRLNCRFHKSFILAKQLFNSNSVIGGNSKEENIGILFQMNELFEKYIGKICKDILHENVQLQKSYKKLLVSSYSNRDFYPLIPDIIINKNNKIKMIIDTKWKKQDNNFFVVREDLFQMYAYLTRYDDVDTVVVLYPKNDEFSGAENTKNKWHLEENENKKIVVSVIDYKNDMTTTEDLKRIFNAYL